MPTIEDATPAIVMSPEDDAALLSTQRQSAMPSPAWSRRSRRRDLVTLDQDKRSVEVPLGRCMCKESMAPLRLCSARSLSTVPLGFRSARSDYEVSLGRHNCPHQLDLF